MNRRQLALVLASLRLWQEVEAQNADEPMPTRLLNIATCCDAFPALTTKEVDSLCEQLNQ